MPPCEDHFAEVHQPSYWTPQNPHTWHRPIDIHDPGISFKTIKTKLHAHWLPENLFRKEMVP